MVLIHLPLFAKTKFPSRRNRCAKQRVSLVMRNSSNHDDYYDKENDEDKDNDDDDEDKTWNFYVRTKNHKML